VTTTAKEHIDDAIKRRTRPRAWALPHEVTWQRQMKYDRGGSDPLAAALKAEWYEGAPGASPEEFKRTRTLLEATRLFSPEEAEALAFAFTGYPQFFQDYNPATDQDSLTKLVELVVDQNPYLRDKTVRSMPIWSMPSGAPGGAPDGAWVLATEALARGIPAAQIQDAVVEAARLHDADPSISRTELATLFTHRDPKEVSAAILGEEEASSKGVFLPATLGLGAGLAATYMLGMSGPVGWAVGAGVALASWMFR
jgi:hypothetical protein